MVFLRGTSAPLDYHAFLEADNLMEKGSGSSRIYAIIIDFFPNFAWIWLSLLNIPGNFWKSCH